MCRAITRLMFTHKAFRSPRIFPVKKLKHQISNKMHLKDTNPPPPRNVLCRLPLISEMVLRVGKNLKSDNYLKTFIPDKFPSHLGDIFSFCIHCQQSWVSQQRNPRETIWKSSVDFQQGNPDILISCGKPSVDFQMETL